MGDTGDLDTQAAQTGEWLESLLGGAIALLEAGHPERAEPLLRKVVRAAPGFTFAVRLLGDALRDMGRLGPAEDCFRQALSVDPGIRGGRRGLMRTLTAAGRLDEASALVQPVLDADPSDWQAVVALGNALHAAGRHDDAVGVFMTIPPGQRQGHAVALASIGVVLRDRGQDGDAINAYRAALEVDPALGAARRNLAVLLYSLGDLDGAAEEVRIWRAFEPENPVAAHMAASLGCEAAPAAASTDYLRTMFDGQASLFDVALARVGYQAPALIARAVLAEVPSFAQVLDIGCGTGLLARELRPHAGHLTGIDLSPKMIAQAQARGLYDRLEQADARTFMADSPSAFDLVTAGDVLIYVGETADWWAGFSCCLRPGGLVGFNVETHDGPEPWRLLPSGRYSHAVAPLRAGLEGAGLTVLAAEPCTLRLERGQPVAGAVLVARKPGPSP